MGRLLADYDSDGMGHTLSICLGEEMSGAIVSRKKKGIRLVQGRRGEAYGRRKGGVSIRRCGVNGADRPLVEKVTIGVDDVGLRELSLDERNDIREFVFSTVCAVGDCVHG
jgi:hypothetical protein